MHRVTYFPSEEPSENLALIEQPEAAVLYLTSVTSDISTLSYVLQENPDHPLNNKIRALLLNQLKSNAFIDHYLSTTAKNSKIIIVRFLGCRADWSYGFEQLYYWSTVKENRKLIILSGTYEQLIELNGLSNIDYNSSLLLAKLLKIGGFQNFRTFLNIINQLKQDNEIDTRNVKVTPISNPYKWDWREDKQNDKVGIIFYSSILNSGDTLFAKEIVNRLRDKGLCPRAIWISSLKDKGIQKDVIRIFRKEQVKAIACTTSFASVDVEETNYGKQIWDILNVPVFQLITSTKSKKLWQNSSRGIDSIDLSLQVALPELDGRITTKITAFKELESDNNNLASPIYKLYPENKSIDWTVGLINSWIRLKYKKNKELKIVIVLSNYPVKDGRIGNGVGLDTPESLLILLAHLESKGYETGDLTELVSHKDLMKLIINSRTNSNESQTNQALSYLPLNEYYKYWNELTINTRKRVSAKWGEPNKAFDLHNKSFTINGIQLGNIAILIQPSRGYTEDNYKEIHSAVLPPPHRYIAQYLWIKNCFKSDVIIHFGKHGTVEWLPGKSIGQGDSCFPQLLVPNIPHLYPFIVNDPGEGSQAKRRTQAVIIDHMTPPLGRATLTKDLGELESLLDEYYESLSFESDRTITLKTRLNRLIDDLALNKVISLDINEEYSKDDIYNNLDSYLCELKETQIRTGLHVFGKLPKLQKLKELALSIALSPSFYRPGLSQLLSNTINIDVDPWNDKEGEYISEIDKNKLQNLTKEKLYKVGDYITWINNQAMYIVEYHTEQLLGYKENILVTNKIINEFLKYINIMELDHNIEILRNDIIIKLIESPRNELISLTKGINGQRIASGPSGSPTKGNLKVLPTGKNFYSVDLRGLPTESAWDLGKRSAEKVLELYLLENGCNLKSIAISVWATSTMRNGGEDISQLLALIGISPVWDRNSRKLIDLEVIPLSVLNRPRVDATLRISGLFRDAFPNLIELVNKAQEMISSLNEPEEYNPYSHLIKQGEATGRIYGSAPEAYGTGLQELINLGNWDKEEELAQCYLQSSKWVYKDSSEPKEDLKGLQNTLKRIEVVIHNQDNREHDLLDSDDYYQFHGGLYSAVKYLSGKTPKSYFGDNSRISRPKVHNLYKEIDKVVRSRLLNEKWIEGMKDHGYKGAFEMSASLDYLFAYDATTDSVPEWCYSSILKVWLENESTYSFLIEQNPWALRDITERLLEAFNRGMWKASTTELDKVRDLLVKSERNIEESNF